MSRLTVLIFRSVHGEPLTCNRWCVDKIGPLSVIAQIEDSTPVFLSISAAGTSNTNLSSALESLQCEEQKTLTR